MKYGSGLVDGAAARRYSLYSASLLMHLPGMVIRKARLVMSGCVLRFDWL